MALCFGKSVNSLILNPEILMKKILLAVLILVIICVMGAFSFVWYTFHALGEHDISIKVKESEDTYRLYATYDRHKTGRIHHLLRDELHNDIFRKDNVDGDFTLDDDTRVHIKTTPGKLVILLDKRENNAGSYHRIRQLGEGVKFSLSH